MKLDRWFTREHKGLEAVFATAQWGVRDVRITKPDGQIIFEQKDVEAPAAWSDQAVTITVSKYFNGKLGTPERECSIRDLISRVVNQIDTWAAEYGFSEVEAEILRDELAYLVLHQLGTFNSPVWFNVGVEQKPQCSACFILSVEDTMESILNLAKEEGMIFKQGSGTGVNYSALRCKGAPLSHGGSSSGPVHFMDGHDRMSGSIKSGGKTRRAARMSMLDVDHPDIMQFIATKRDAEYAAHALVEAGFSADFDNPEGAYSIVPFQNSNHSVRVSDDFMAEAVNYPGDSRAILQEMAEAAWVCGDPGIQYDDTVNKWHTCPGAGRIRASNPCGEYTFIDNSACNLASLNLVNFLVNGQFNCQDFEQAVRMFIIAQDILVDRAKYPTEKIAENSRRFRPLGLGYCNLGGVLVALGLGYGTEKGRDFAAQVTALMHGSAVLTSMELADRFGAFLGYEEEPYHDVLLSHADAVSELVNKVGYGEIRSELERIWNEAASQLPRPMRNAQLTLLAPTGTIGFMLGADTTGGEPMLFLRGVKSLVGGGQMVIVPEIVKMGLKNMGVTHVEPIFQAITEGLDLEDIPLFFPQDKFDIHVFDTALPNKHGRYIKPEEHIKMMAAIQPFLSGAISKTVNLPGDATEEDILNLYVQGWKLGLKSLTVYRNGCKKSQPVGSGKEEKDDHQKGSPLLVELELRGHGSQRPLPDECDSKRKKMRIGEHVAYLHVGLYDDGVPGEIFLDMSKQGSTISGLTDAFSTAVSIGLQYGVPLEKYVDKFSFMDFEPRGFTGDKKIPFAKSIVDYVFRWIGKTFLADPEEEQVIEEQVLAAPSIPKMDLSGPPCPRCGHPTSPGGCGECPTCGKVGGCG